MLTHEQRAEFKRLGHLAVDGGVDRDLAREAGAAAETAVPESFDDRAEMARATDREDLLADADADGAFETINDRLFEYAETLVGEGVLAETDAGEAMDVAVGYPSRHGERDPESPQVTDVDPQLPGYSGDPNAEPDYVALTATVYLDRVLPKGGGFAAWSASHWNAGEFFNTHALQAGREGTWAIADETTHHISFEPRSRRADQFDPFEIHGEPGTVVLAHGKLERAWAPNLTPYPRLSATSAFAVEDAEANREAGAAEIWRHWPAMDDVESHYGEWFEGGHRIEG